MSSSEAPPALSEERFQELQGDHVDAPEDNGPAVHTLQPSAKLENEYAGGDKNFIAKIPELMKSYPWLREIRKDGNCGIQAISFGYFEFLLCYCSLEKISEEEVRFKKLDELINNLGWDAEDYNESAHAVFQNLKSWKCLALDEALTQLEKALDDPYIIFHFRLFAAVQIRGHADFYSAFLADKTTDQVVEEILIPKMDIDQFAIRALYDCILEPLGLSLRILDLNRSETTQSVSEINFDPENTQDLAGVINLLYRPGHYDLIYEKQP